MRNRILSFAMAIALLISLIPMAAVPAKAASAFVASQEMIEVLKTWEGFSRKPYWDYKQWTVGYGTRVPDGKLQEYQTNGIPEEEAEALLQEFLVTMGAELNTFFDKFGLKMDQGKFDALLSFSFNCGTGWLYKPSTVRTAIIEGWEGDDLIFALAQWSNSGNETIPGLIRRRLAEADMYLNGNYASTPPVDYCYVRFNANGGETDIAVQGYNVTVEPEVRAVPTYGNFVFEGWYTDPTGGEKVTKLDATVKNYTLYAHWSAGNGESAPNDEPQDITGTAVNYVKQIATGVLNSFEQPFKGSLVVDAYPNGETVKIVAEYVDGNGVKWGQISDGGWINLAYTQDVTAAEENEPGVKITVTGTDVNLRRGPSTSYGVIGTANKGDVLEITRTETADGYVWGKSGKGWIALKYTDYDAVVNGGNSSEDNKDQGSNNDTNNNNTNTPENGNTSDSGKAVTGKIKLQSGTLNIRSGPSTGYGVVGYYNNGESVTILEIKAVGAMEWGKVDRGWICMTYVQLDKQETPEDSNTGDTNQKDDNADIGAADKEDNKEDNNTGSDANSGNTSGNGGTAPDQGSGNTNSSVTGKIVLSSGKLNVRNGAGMGYTVVAWLSAGEKVIITEQTTINGTAWGRIDKGWICMNYVSLDKVDDNTQSGGSEETGTTNISVKGVVSANGSKLRVRTGPGSSYGIAAYLNDGAKVEILEQKTVNGTVWGRISNGWISMNYVKQSDSSDDTTSKEETDDNTVIGTVIADCLHVRSDAGTNNQIVARLYTGEKVTILETKTVDGVKWGRISAGWICMDYVK